MVGVLERGKVGGLEVRCCDAVSVSAMLFSAARIRFGGDTYSMSIYVLLQRP